MALKGSGFFGTRGGALDKAPKFVFRRTMAASLIGGTTSAISGGKFANGAATAAIQHLFNNEAVHRQTVAGDEIGGAPEPAPIEFAKAEGATDEDVAFVRAQWERARTTVGPDGETPLAVKGMIQYENSGRKVYVFRQAKGAAGYYADGIIWINAHSQSQGVKGLDDGISLADKIMSTIAHEGAHHYFNHASYGKMEETTATYYENQF